MANEQSVIKMPENFGSYLCGDQMVALTPTLIKQNVCATLTDVEIFNFGFLCMQNNLNPFTREAFAVKYGTSPASLVIAKHGLANRAERSNHLKSKVGGIIQIRQNKQTGEWETKEVKGEFVEPGWQIYGGWAVIERDDKAVPFESRVMMSEYNNDKNPLWKTKPCTMLAKVAMHHCLREAFPCETQGNVYYEEEFSDDLNPSRQRAVKKPISDFEEEAQVVDAYAVSDLQPQQAQEQ